MCYRNFSFYNNLYNNEPSTIVQDRVNKFAKKYKLILTNNEYYFLAKGCSKISNFYMLLKIPESKEI